MNDPTAKNPTLGALQGAAANRQSAAGVLKEMAAHKRREADQLDMLAALASLVATREQDEALWAMACGYLQR